jgi:hypothetical protein
LDVRDEGIWRDSKLGSIPNGALKVILEGEDYCLIVGSTVFAKDVG